MRKMKLDLQKFASVTFTGPEVEGNYSWAKIQGRVTCEETYVGTTIENKSKVKCTVEVRCTTGGTQAANWRMGVTCNGVTKTAKSTYNMTVDSAWKVINSVEFEVQHNEDGKKTIEISGYAQAPEYPTSLGNAKSSFSGNMTLTTIPRATSLDSFSGSKRIGVNNDVVINFTKKSSNFTTTLIYATKSDFSDAETIVEKITNASTYSWTIPINLLNKIPNSKTLDIYVMLATFDGNTQIGTAQTNSFTAYVYEDNCRPVWNTHTIEETDATAKQLVTTANKFIANLSKPKFTFSATGQYGATIKYYQVNNTTRTSGFTDSAFNTNGYTIKVVDSRGVTNTYTFTTTYVPYFTPIFEEVKLFRDTPTSNKVFSYFKIKFFNNTSEVKFDNPQALSYKFNYQEAGGDEQETSITPDIYDDGTSRYAENETELGNTFNYKKSVDWTFSFVDLTGKTFTTNTTLPMGIPLMNGKMEGDDQVLYINGEIKGEGIEPFIKKDTEARVSNVVSKNVFSSAIEQGSIAFADGTKSPHSKYVRTAERIKVKPNTTYTLSFKGINFSTDNGFIYFKDGVYVRDERSGLNPTITIPENVDEIMYNFHNQGNPITPDMVHDVQLEEGSIATSYVPYLNLEEAMQEPKIEKIYITEFMNVNAGFSFNDSDYIFKDRNRYFGDIVITKNSGFYNSTQDVVATLKKSVSRAINTGCFISEGVWITTKVGYCFIGGKSIAVADSTNSNCNVAKIHFDIVVDE